LVAIASLLIAAGCSVDSGAKTTAAETTTTTSEATIVTTEATTTATESTTTTTETAPPPADQNLDTFCNAYLAFAGSKDPEGRVGPLNVIWEERGPDAPEELEGALETLKTADYGSEDVRPQHVVLKGFAIPLCLDIFNEGVVGAEDDATAAEQFFAALVAGDKQTALTLAPANTVALFEPWNPYPTQGDYPQMSPGEGQFYVSLTTVFSFRCEVNGGIVTGCFFG
jgi:hypothetical protein